MTRATYAVARSGNLDGALARFRDRFNCEPVAVVVNVHQVDQVTAAVIGAGLGIPVAGNGGALIGEFWLERPAVDVQAAAEALRPHSLTARCDRARRTAEPMTPERARQLILMEVER